MGSPTAPPAAAIRARAASGPVQTPLGPIISMPGRAMLPGMAPPSSARAAAMRPSTSRMPVPRAAVTSCLVA